MKTIAILTVRWNVLCRLYQGKLLILSMIIVRVSVEVSDFCRS